MTGWVRADERLPTAEEAGGFGAVEVIVQCDNLYGTEPAQGLRLAKVIHIGRNPNRVLWVDMDTKGSQPIENGAWFVSHWRAFPRFPKPISSQVSA